MASPDPTEVLDIVARCTRTSLAHTSLTDVLYDVSSSVVELLGGAGTGISLALEGGDLQFVSATSEVVTHLEHIQDDTREGPCQEALATRSIVSISDLAQVDRWATYRVEAVSRGIHAVVGVPLCVGERCVGSMDVYDPGPREWGDIELQAIELLAGIAASQVLRTEERDQAQRLADQLEGAMEGRVLIEQAKGILAGERGISLNEAFEQLRRHARSNRAPLSAIASAVVKLGLRPDPRAPRSPS